MESFARSRMKSSPPRADSRISSGGTVDAIVLSDGAVTGTDELGKLGADRVLLATHPDFPLYSPDGLAATIAAAPQAMSLSCCRPAQPVATSLLESPRDSAWAAPPTRLASEQRAARCW